MSGDLVPIPRRDLGRAGLEGLPAVIGRSGESAALRFVEFPEKSRFCSICGTPLTRRWSAITVFSVVVFVVLPLLAAVSCLRFLVPSLQVECGGKHNSCGARESARAMEKCRKYRPFCSPFHQAKHAAVSANSDGGLYGLLSQRIPPGPPD